MRILFIRHADPYYPADSLTPAGCREAQALAEHLAQAGVDAIYSSPRGRARLTAHYSAEKLGLPVQIEPWLAELDGLLYDTHGRAAWDLDGQLLRSPEVLRDLNTWQSVPPLDHPRLVEQLRVIQAGSDSFLERQGFARDGHIYRVKAKNTRKVAVFGHLGAGLAWLAWLLDIPLPLVWAGFFLHPSSVTTILFDERRPGAAMPRLTGLGDLSHLACAGLEPSRAGIIANWE